MNLRAAAELLANNGESAFPKVVEAARNDPDPDDVAFLAQILAGSGQQVGPYTNSADVASTGGPSSLSTLLCPLYLRHLGFAVPKLGVPGRPAGGVDVLSSVPGYRANLTLPEIELAMDRSGYAHFLGGNRFAPLDARLFAYRQDHGAQQVPALVAASLISKKLAVGLHRAGVEVRVGRHGNMGRDREEARLHAQLLVSAAAALGLKVVCFLTDATVPFQPYIGRGEALVAMADILRSQPGAWLRRHASECWKMAVLTAGTEETSEPHGDELLPHMEANLLSQGSSLDAFYERSRNSASEPRSTIVARDAGCWIPDLGLLRTEILRFQGNTQDSFGDRSGLIVVAEPGRAVTVGSPIALWRGPGDLERINSAFRMDPDCYTGESLEIVTAPRQPISPEFRV